MELEYDGADESGALDLSLPRVFRSVVELSTDGVIVEGFGRGVVEVNPAAEAMCGWRRDEALGQQLASVVALEGDEAARLWAGDWAGAEAGAPSPALEVVLRSRHGVERVVEVRVITESDGSGGLLRLLLLREIGRRRKVDEQLRVLSRAVEASPATVVITDVQGTVEYVNPKFVETTGYRPEEIIGKNTRVLKSGDMPPEVYRVMWREITEGRVWRGEFHNRRKDGSLYWELASISPVRDDAGAVTHFIAVKEDITARKVAEAALQESEEKYHLLFDWLFDAVCLLDTETGAVLEANTAFCSMFGYRLDEAVGIRIRSLVGAGGDVSEMSRQLSTEGSVHVPRTAGRRKDGSELPVEVSVGSFTWRGRPVACVILRDITERVRSQELLERLSTTDGLTGLTNWRRFNEQLESEINRAVRSASPLSVIMVDIDDFKLYNDTYGHLVGDDCLRSVALALREALRRPTDLLARYGGEEFAAVLPDTPGPGALTVAETMRALIEALRLEHRASRVAGTVTVSVGVASVVPCEGLTVAELLGAADGALYRAKEQGRNRVVVADGPCTGGGTLAR